MREIREYIRAELRKIDGMFAEHETGMKFNEIPKTKIDKLYRLTFGEFSTDPDGRNFLQDEGPVEIKLYRKIEKSAPGTYDNCIDLAKKIRSALIHPKNWASTLISSVIPVNFGVTEYEGNQDILEIKLNLTFTVSNSL